MAVQSIDNLKQRSLSIIQETELDSVTGERLGGLLNDMIDTLDGIKKGIYLDKLSIGDVANDLNVITAGKVLDARQGKILLDNFNNRLESIRLKEELYSWVFEDYKYILNNGDVLDFNVISKYSYCYIDLFDKKDSKIISSRMCFVISEPVVFYAPVKGSDNKNDTLYVEVNFQNPGSVVEVGSDLGTVDKSRYQIRVKPVF